MTDGQVTVVKNTLKGAFCTGCGMLPAEMILDFPCATIFLCWTCAMEARNGVERERLQKHERLDEMERLEVETALEWSTGLDQ